MNVNAVLEQVRLCANVNMKLLRSDIISEIIMTVYEKVPNINNPDICTITSKTNTSSEHSISLWILNSRKQCEIYLLCGLGQLFNRRNIRNVAVYFT